MLLTKEQGEYLEPIGPYTYRAIKLDQMSEGMKEELISVDGLYSEIYGHPVIVNLEELKA